MKTKNQKNNESGLGNQEQLNNNTVAETPSAQAQAQTEKTDHRLPIDREARKQNRTLPTPKVLNLLHTQLPAAYRLAEVVGKWVWVRFPDRPSGTDDLGRWRCHQQLAQLGFHWNRERQAWQHPCGKFSLGSQADPYEKYSAYYPARIRTPRRAEASAKAGAQPQTTAAHMGSRTSVAAA